MIRRDLLTATIACCTAAVGLDARATPPALTQTLDFGDWSFALPADWKPASSGIDGVTYLESANGARGCYIKAMRFAPSPHRTAAEQAAHVQSIEKQSMTTGEQDQWRVVAERSIPEGASLRSELDLFSKARGYRVLSVVLTTESDFVQLTLHDYDCHDYSASVEFFAPIAASLHRR